jgi:hypothetical protein
MFWVDMTSAHVDNFLSFWISSWNLQLLKQTFLAMPGGIVWEYNLFLVFKWEYKLEFHYLWCRKIITTEPAVEERACLLEVKGKAHRSEFPEWERHVRVLTDPLYLDRLSNSIYLSSPGGGYYGRWNFW